MLTARRVRGDDSPDTLARILMKEPDWTAPLRGRILRG
jgi:hypothetical protein